MLRVAVVADDPLTRTGLVALLEAQQLVVSEVATVSEASRRLDRSQGIDVVVYVVGERQEEVLLPGLDMPVLLLLPAEAERGYPRLIDGEIPLGAGSGVESRGWFNGAVSREADGRQLAAAVSAAAAGLVVLDPDFAPLLAAAGFESGEEGTERQLGAEADLPLEPLSTRELEVLWLLADGLSNKAIAGKLDLSEHTVKFHLNTLFDKLAVHNRTEAVSRAIRVGLIAL